MTAPWTPGSYLARRRQLAGLSLDQVAAAIGTAPHAISERERRLWLATIEADVVGIPASIGSLLPIFRFDPAVLAQLVGHAADPSSTPMPRICRICACSEHDDCVSPAGGLACAWVGDEDICTACALPPTASVEIIAPGAVA